MGDKTKRISIKLMMLVPMLAVNMVIVLIFVGTISFSNIHFRMQTGEVAALERTVNAQGEQMQRMLTNIESLGINMAEEMQLSVEKEMNGGSDIRERLRGSAGLTTTSLSACLDGIIDVLRLNEVTGAFVILDASDREGQQGGFDAGQAAAIYMNDEDTTSLRADNTDLNLFCGPRDIARQMSLPLHVYWQEQLDLELFSDLRFITEPYEMAETDPRLEMSQLGYWIRPLTRQDGKELILFTIPLRDSNNVPYGIAGVELSVEELQKRMSPSVLGYTGQSFYAVAGFVRENVLPNWLAASGSFAAERKNDTGLRQASMPEYNSRIREMTFSDGAVAISVYFPFAQMNRDNVYGQETWGLIGGVESSVLFSGADNLQRFFLLGAMIALLAGCFFSLISANWFVRPISRLADQLQSIDPDERIALDKTRIKEIDLLIDSIEELSGELGSIGRRTTETIEMTEMPIGFLEINIDKERVYLTDYLFELFDLEKKGGSNFIPMTRWNWLFKQLENNRETTMENIYLMDFVANQPFRWLRVKMARSKERTFGIVIDATDEIIEKKRLEYERDTDPLTGLLNRQAFFTDAAEVLEKNPGKTGVMLFADLDNLKYVNDTYGHDFGDRYIRATARVFGQFAQRQGVVSRMSGDEFAIFLYGYDTKDELVQIVGETYSSMDDARISLPNGQQIKVRCSIGFSWYPDDSDDLDQLVRYADFAMYETKRSLKGSIRQFNVESYLKNSYLVEKNEEFNQFIEQNQVRYAFQPIVDIYSGAVFAYEALMRPQTPELNNPYRVLQIAKAQAKLYQVERMTVFNTFQWLSENRGQMGSRKMFVNSIPNQLLSPKDIAELEKKYGSLFSSVVIEITENEQTDDDFLTEKLDIIRRLGATIAIDDFGSGYSNEVIVFNSNPNYIKLDMTLVRDVHKEDNKRRLVENIIRYAKPLGIKIIAEGIECREEAEEMIKLGADYLQGYYLAEPAMTLEEIPIDIVLEIRGISAMYRDRRKSQRPS